MVNLGLNIPFPWMRHGLYYLPATHETSQPPILGSPNTYWAQLQDHEAIMPLVPRIVGWIGYPPATAGYLCGSLWILSPNKQLISFNCLKKCFFLVVWRFWELSKFVDYIEHASQSVSLGTSYRICIDWICIHLQLKKHTFHTRVLMSRTSNSITNHKKCGNFYPPGN